MPTMLITALLAVAQRGSWCRTVVVSAQVYVTRCSCASLKLSFLVDPNPVVLPSGLPFAYSRFGQGGALPRPGAERRLAQVQQELPERVPPWSMSLLAAASSRPSTLASSRKMCTGRACPMSSTSPSWRSCSCRPSSTWRPRSRPPPSSPLWTTNPLTSCRLATRHRPPRGSRHQRMSSSLPWTCCSTRSGRRC